MTKLRPSLVSLAVMAMCAGANAWAQDAAELAVVTIVGTMPIPSISQPLSEIASAVQTANSTDLANSQALDLSSFMNQRLGGVYVNEVQGNPHQMDVNFRGFTASPLLGTPQGLSVYMDGVRMNQPFGDVVSWDLMPRSAISHMTLMPGSNPMFGLNTLGGALAVQSKSGLSHPGTSVQTTIGSGQRRSVEMAHGGRNDKGLHWFVTGNAFNEEGWREASPSRVRQVFGKLGWKDGASDVTLSLSHAGNALTGNGMQEERMLANDYRSVYTKPDETNNRSTLLNLTGKHALSDTTLLAGNAYYRTMRTHTFNGNVNDGALATNFVNGELFPRADCLQEVQGGQPNDASEKCTGMINRTSTKQKNYGFSGQLTLLDNVFDMRNQFTTGLGYDTNRTEFKQSGEYGYINPDRSITGVQQFEEDADVHLKGKASTWSVFATDTVSIQDRWHVTMSGRYNRTHIVNADQILPGGGAGSLDGNQVFQRFNPAIGTTYVWTPALNAYLGYNEGSRTPTSIELGCADPANPCKLPNAMAGDPPLKQVVTKTWEAGLRGALSRQTQWTAGVFHAQSTDDILFVTANSSHGYFKNFGKTQRQGLELGLNSQQGQLKLAAHYTLLKATYQNTEEVGGESNSTNNGDPIQIRAGNTIPLTPKHMLKLHADYAWNEAWSTGLGMTSFSGMYARGNENNQHTANGGSYLGSGRTTGYAVFNFNAGYKATKDTKWMLNVMNIFNRQYATAAQLGPAAFTANGGAYAANANQKSMFVAPGAPRSVWLSLGHSFN